MSNKKPQNAFSWVNPQVLRIKSTVLNPEKLDTVFSANLLQPHTAPTTMLFTTCSKSDRVCYSRMVGEKDFFFVYEALFTVSGLRLPFTDFQMKILDEINVAPTQLHPNSWSFVRSFELLCESLNLNPTVSAFFYFYQVVRHNQEQMSWVRLHSRRGGRPKILIFDESLKGKSFKGCFFKVGGSEDGSTPFFLDENRKPKFPLYWSKFVRSPDSPDLSRLSQSDLMLVNKLKQLDEPRLCADLIRCPGSDIEEEEEEDEVKQEVKSQRKRRLTRAATEQMKKQKVIVNTSPHCPAEHTPSVANPIVEFEYLHAFDGEGQIESLWDRRFDFDHIVREKLYSRTDQDKLRRSTCVNVGRFVKNYALRIAASVQFLMDEMEVRRRYENELLKENHTLKEEVSRLSSKLEEEEIARNKVESLLARCDGELAKTRKMSEYTEGYLFEELKNSVTESFQNALHQVHLGFPHLNLDCITLDPFKVVKGGELVKKVPKMLTG